MNEPLQHPVSSATPDYRADGYGLAIARTALIRARRFDLIDWEMVAEEIEDLGKREWRAAESASRVVLVRQLKWMHQPLENLSPA